MQKYLDEKGYPAFFLDLNASWVKTLLATLAISGACVVSLIVYSRFSGDMSPDSPLGYLYAIVGTTLMMLATILYARHRKQRQRQIGSLNNSLNWHISLGVSALVVLCFHSFGNLNPRTGTYALYGMLAIVMSGIVGRVIDKIVPRLIAQSASKALTEDGNDRIENISRTAQEIVSYNTEQLRDFKSSEGPSPSLVRKGEAVVNGPMSMDGTVLPSSWDIAYLTLDETPQEASRMAQQYRFVPDRKSPLTKPGALMPGYTDQMEEIQGVQQAMQKEQFYRAIIRYWRMFHVVLVIITIGVTLWHLEYATALLIPVFMHH
jgi:hypothetical protein